MRARHAYAEALLTRARSLPGVRQAELTTDRESITMVLKEGDPFPENPEAHVALVSAVSPGFVPMLGMSLARGRWLAKIEPPAALLINEALARRHFPNADPIGAGIQHPELDEGQDGTIMGIVRDLKYARIDAEAGAAVIVDAAIAYSVAERTHEIGIRLAFGAERSRVVRMIVGREW